MTEAEEKKVNEAYDNLMDAATGDLSGSEKELREALNQAQEVVDTINEVKNSDEEANLESEVIAVDYDAQTGVQNPRDAIDMKEVQKQQLKVLSEDDSEVDTEKLKEKLTLSNIDISDINIINDVADLIKRKRAGEKIKYSQLPEKIKMMINTNIASMGNTGNIKDIRSYYADFLIDSLSKDSKEFFDLDLMVKSFNDDMAEFADQTDKEFGDMLITLGDERIENLNKAIEAAKEDGNDKAVEHLQQIRDNIDSAYDLTDFKEFCKHVRIKNYELEVPDKVFKAFNAKFVHSKYNINDIRMCPMILTNHFKPSTDESIPEAERFAETYNLNIKLCIAFCKYCLNKSAENAADYTFMYYFVRNIINIDHISSKGKDLESISDKYKEFYNGFYNNLAECRNNLIRVKK